MKIEIHHAATNAQRAGDLDQVIYNADVIELFASTDYKTIEAYWDVPIKTLVALRPRDFYVPSSNWRQATLGLHCEGWETRRDDIVNYFTSPLRLNWFPAPKSEQELRIGFTGGACYCKLGQHRAAAAKSWLAYSRPTSAILRQASCFYRPLRASCKQLIAECLKNGAILKYFYDPASRHETKHPFLLERSIELLILVEHASSASDLYAICTNHEELVSIPPGKNTLSSWFRLDFRSRCLRLDFEVMSFELMQLMLNDSQVLEWIENA